MAEADIPVVVGRFDALLRSGLADVLRAGRSIRVCASNVDAADLASVVAVHKPQVVIVDEACFDATVDRLESLAFKTSLLALAHNPTRELGLRILAAGSSCIASNVSAAGLLDAVRRAALRERTFMAADGRRIDRRYPDSAPALTPREAEVLTELSRGSSNAEIALALSIGNETVRTYVASLLHKLNIRSRKDLIGMPSPPSRQGKTD